MARVVKAGTGTRRINPCSVVVYGGSNGNGRAMIGSRRRQARRRLESGLIRYDRYGLMVGKLSPHETQARKSLSVYDALLKVT